MGNTMLVVKGKMVRKYITHGYFTEEESTKRGKWLMANRTAEWYAVIDKESGKVIGGENVSDRQIKELERV